MKTTINGDEVTLGGEMSVSDLLVERNVKMPDMVTVELNGEILKRDAYASTTIREGDAIEFLYYMGGGR